MIGRHVDELPAPFNFLLHFDRPSLLYEAILRGEHDGDPIDDIPRSIISVFGEEFCSTDRVVLINTVEKIMPQLIVSSTCSETPKKRLRLLCLEAMRIIRDLNFAMNSRDFLGARTISELWWHRPKPTYQTTFEHGVEKDLLQDAAAAYLARPWMQNSYIDWCIVYALAHWELNAFAHRLFLRMAQIYFVITIIVVITVADASFQMFEGKEITSALLAAALLAAPSFAVPSFVRMVNRRPLFAMNRAYDELDGAVLSPSRVRDQFRAAEKQGVVWPTALWPILEAAMARNTTIGNVSE
jgi:hypothetical protein